MNLEENLGNEINIQTSPDFNLSVDGSVEFGNAGTSGYIWANIPTVQDRVVKDTLTHKIFKLALPEIKKEEVNIELKEDINGWFIEVTLDTDSFNDYLHTITYNQREYIDPTNYDLNSIEAEMDNGSLTIMIAKKKQTDIEPKKIEIG